MIKKFGIRAQTLLLGIIPALLIFVILFSFFLNARLKEVNEYTASKGELLAKHIALASEFDVLIGDIDKLEVITDRYINDIDIAFIEIRNKSGRVLVHSRNTDSPNIGKLITFQADIIQPRTYIPGDPLSGEEWTLQKEKSLGSVLIALSTTSSINKQKTIIEGSVFSASLALVATLIFAWLIGSRISAPLIALTAIVQSLQKGELKTRSKAQSNGQIGELEQGINSLADSISTHEESQETYIHALEKSKHAAEEASAAKGQFLATMSHELRTPMNGALGMLELLQQTSLNEQQRQYSRIAAESTQHLLTVVNDILDFSRIEQGKLTLENHYFSLIDALEQSKESFRFEAEHKNIELTLETDPRLKGVHINQDEARLRQIIINLLGNAIKFTLSGKITLSAHIVNFHHDSMELEISVSDTGIGIPEQHLNKIFEPFKQADGSTERNFGGSGLGLAIVKNICSLMGTKITATSKLGAGSTFTLNMYVDHRSGDAASDIRNGKITQDLSGKILVVEDNLVNQMVVVGMLKKMGLDVEAVNGGYEALEYLEADDGIDLVLMDCQMPGMDGLEATRRIRAHPKKAINQLAIIALTANALKSDRQLCLAAGMNDYLSKPVQLLRLHDTVHKWLPSKKKPLNNTHEQH